MSEVAGRQLRVERHCGVGFELVLALDVPVLQMVEQPVEVDTFFRLSLPAVVEQVIDVPKLALPGCAVQRAALSEPQLVEQLVEVPTVLSYSLLLQRTAEQTIGIAVPGRGGGARGGLHGLSQGQGSTAVSGADYVDTSVLGRGGGSRGGLHGLSEGQGSTAGCGADFVVSPVPHGRGGGTRGGRHGLSQGQGSTTFPPPERISERIMEQNVDFPVEVFMVFKVFLTGPAALSEQVPAPAVHAAPAPVGEFMASAPSVHAAPVSSGGDASRVEQDVGVEGVDFLGRVVFHTGTCVMLGVVDFKWRDLGVGTYGFLRDSTGATFFQFWRAVSCSRKTLSLDSCFVVTAQVLPGDGATLSSKTGPVTTGTLCGSSCQSWLAGSMTRGTPHRWVRSEGLASPHPFLGAFWGVVRSLLSLWFSRRGQGFRSLSPWLVLVCIFLPYVTLHCALVCGYVLWAWIVLALCGSGARVYCRARRCTNTAYGQRLRLSLRGLVALRKFRAFVYGYGLWARACFSVVLVLRAICAHWSVATAYGQGLRVFLRGPGVQCDLRALVHGYGLWARIALFSVVLVLSASCAHWYADMAYGQWLRVFLRGPGAQRHCVCWCTDTASGQGCACFSVSWCSCVQSGHLRRSGLMHEAGQFRAVYTGTRPGVPPPSGRGRGGGTLGACSQAFLPPN